jgi:phosphoglycolate phosphatase-like HAD superfamily hydrolase
MPLAIERVGALCFDVDGTLSDSDDYYVARIAAKLRCVPGVSDPSRSARRLVMWMESPGNALLGLADRVGLDHAVIRVLDWWRRHGGGPHRRLPVMPGMAEVLKELHVRFPIAVVSARDEESTMAFLDHAGWRKHFDAVITALSAAHTKPFPDPILLAARRMGTSPDSCLMIGDTTVDIRAGRAAGAQTVGVLCGYGEEGELRRAGADLILRKTSELGDVLLNRVA